MTALTSPHAVPFHPGLFEWPVQPGSEPRLIASRCTACGRFAFPAKHFCSFCQTGEQEGALLLGRGRVYAFTTIDLPPKIMASPYIAAYVDMEERVRIFGQIVDAAASDLSIGDSVRVDFRVLRTDAAGHPVVGYTFVRMTEATS